MTSTTTNKSTLPTIEAFGLALKAYPAENGQLDQWTASTGALEVSAFHFRHTNTWSLYVCETPTRSRYGITFRVFDHATLREAQTAWLTMASRQVPQLFDRVTDVMLDMSMEDHDAGKAP